MLSLRVSAFDFFIEENQREELRSREAGLGLNYKTIAF